MYHFIRTGIFFRDNINIHTFEDYVTVLVGKKYGAENVFDGFRRIKKPDMRVKFVEEYAFSLDKEIIKLIQPILDFEIPELSDIKDIIV